jgi:hypothetical protein
VSRNLFQKCKCILNWLDFDDDDLGSSSIPFGRPAFGGGGGGSSSGFGVFGSPVALESPGTATPFGTGERSFFHHSRGDSSASVDSAHSGTTRFIKPNLPFGHSSQSSIATSSTSAFIPKKPSFASFRNAFKKNNSDAPPVPPPIESPYPVLRNPFNRSNSSLTSPRTVQRPTKRPSRSHVPQHSMASDGGSDLGHGFFSPPPVPRVPGAFRSDTPPSSDFEDDKVVMDPKTPSEYALHAVFMRFASLAEAKINDYLRQPLVSLLDHAPVRPS